MTKGSPTEYDEFALFGQNADEAGLAWTDPPTVVRRTIDMGDGRQASALLWGTAEPHTVLIHGGAQNAHTWDTVALALRQPLVAVDLPGHGHSDWRDDHDYRPSVIAEDVAVVIRGLVPEPRLVVGMSLGGLTSICLAAAHPELVPRLVIVDVTPGVDRAKAEPILSFIGGPVRFASFDEILERTVQHNPTRSVPSLRRGILHNAKELPDGSWTWRWDPIHGTGQAMGEEGYHASLWDRFAAVRAPVLLLRGTRSGVVGNEDIEEALRRKPDTRVEEVEGAGHSIQGDRPLELVAVLERELSLDAPGDP